MNRTEHELELMRRYLEGVASLEETQELEALIVNDASVRQDFLRYTHLDSALAGIRRSQPLVVAPRRSVWLSWRPLTAAAAGLVIGLFSASLVLAVTSPKATAERLFSLVNGSFDEAHLGHGFPHQTGIWSGDEAAIGDGKLRFITAEGDAGDPGSRAIACDVFQLVDLRSLKATPRSGGETVLELSASLLDSRPPNTNPSVTFFCQLYLFQGDPTQMHQMWPRCIADALASGSAQVTTLGFDAKGARTLTARCLLPEEADFAVAQIVARPNLRPAKLDGLFADDVKLTLKTAPQLPVQIVRR
jgi:hypothetical protein